MRTITVIGTSYVGLTTGTCFADLGNHVTCIDIDEVKIGRLCEGILPIHEPGLAEVVVRNMQAGRLRFTTSYEEGMRGAEFVFIAVGTPDDGSGGADLRQVRSAAQSIAEHLREPVIVVNKSTVPIGTGDLVTQIIEEHRSEPIPFWVVSNPEFLREGNALEDCMRPERVVLGGDANAAERVADLYRPLSSPIIVTDLRTAEMIKYASNAFLATKISFINEIAGICERLGADVREVALGMGYDSRIGPAFLEAGVGFGGSCFPKDVRALMRMAKDADLHPQLLQAVMDINRDRRSWVVERLSEHLGALEGKRIGVLGVAFKPNTDDIRDAPALTILDALIRAGAHVSAYDPAAAAAAGRILSEVSFCSMADDVADGADAIVLLTEWNEFRGLDLAGMKERMRGNLLVDGRNLYEPAQIAALGYCYVGVARGSAALRPSAADTSTLPTSSPTI